MDPILKAVIAAIASTVFCPLLILIAIHLMGQDCQDRWEDSGLPVSWSPADGCKIFISGQWVKESRVNNML